jgi:hypothetical protein
VRATEGEFFGAIEGATVPMLLHLPAGYSCKFGFLDETEYRRSGHSTSDYFEGEFFLQRSPAEATIRDTLSWRAWSSVLTAFRDWLTYVKREMTEPDFWKVSPPSDLLPAIGPTASNEPFTAEEQRHIAATLEEVRHEVHTLRELSDDQKKSFDATVQQMLDSAGRLGKRDWVNAFLGAYVGWVVTSALGSQVAQSVFDLIASKLSWVWSEIPKLFS